MAAALESDPLFRQRIGERFKQAQPELAGAVETGTPPAAADPVDVAAAAYVLRPAGWVKLVAAAGEEALRADAERADEAGRRELERLREELAAAKDRSRGETEQLRHDLDAARKEAESLHRKLRSAQSDVKRGEAAMRRAQGEIDAAKAEAAAQVSTAESESRMAQGPARRGRGGPGGEPQDGPRGPLRGGHAAAAAARHGAGRGPGAAPRTGVAARLRTPGGHRGRGGAGADVPEGHRGAGALRDRSGAARPTARAAAGHLVVDGYNVTKTGYPTMPLEKQRLRLLGSLSALAARSGAEVTCVFDGAELAAPVLLAPPRGVRVLFSKPGVTADELIRQLVRAEPPGRPVVVVSTDREVADGVAKAGARPVASALLLKRLSRLS